MSNNYWENQNNNLAYNNQSTAETQAAGLAQFFTQIYTWMTLGLAITGFLSVLVSSNEMLATTLIRTPFLFFGLILVELGMVMAFTRSAARGASFQTLAAMFIAYAALNGITLSVVFMAYTAESVTQCFFVTAASFGALSVYGYVTKKDLSGLGRFLFMGVIGLIVASIVGMFWHSSALHMVISVVGVLIFAGLTAYDTQALKTLYFQSQNDTAALGRLSLQGALKLYLDFINLMLYLLRFMGRRK